MRIYTCGWIERSFCYYADFDSVGSFAGRWMESGPEVLVYEVGGLDCESHTG